MNQRYDRVKKYIEEKLEYNVDDLIEKSNKVWKIYEKKFSTRNMFEESCFPKIVTNSWKKEKTGYWTLTEKCIRRGEDISFLRYFYENDEQMLNEILDAQVFYEIIIGRALPLEVLWCMEFEKEDDGVFDENEQWAFDYLKVIAEFYLEETEKYEGLLEKKEEEHKKVKVLKKEGQPNEEK